MFFQRVKTKGLGHNAYVLGCGEGQAVVVDPRRDVSEYLKLARENNLSIACVFETHRQEDFEFGSRALADATGAKIVTGTHELFGKSDVQLADGQEFKVGTTRFVALATPGHTPESMCYAVYPKDTDGTCWGVFTGDTLFVGDTGRTDLTDADKTARKRRPAVRLGAAQAAGAGRPGAGAAGARRGLGLRRQHLVARRHHAGHREEDQQGVQQEPPGIHRRQAAGKAAATAVLQPHGAGQPAKPAGRCRRRPMRRRCCSRASCSSGCRKA